jgi:hypothetical protein
MVSANSRLHSSLVCILLGYRQTDNGSVSHTSIEDELVSLDELQDKIAEFEDYIQSSDVAAMQSRRAIFYCIQSGSDFIPQSCKLREWVWHFGTCSKRLRWNGSERMTELNVFNVWLNCSSRARQKGMSSTVIRKGAQSSPTTTAGALRAAKPGAW